MLTKLQTEKFTRQFQQLDADGSGALRWNDFTELLERLRVARGWSADSSRVEQVAEGYRNLWNALLKHSDGDGDGQVELSEWLSFHKYALYDSQVLLQLDPAYEELVVSMTKFVQETLDDDGNGEITATEYRQFCQAYGIPADEAQACFQKLDKNSDGVLTRPEILDLVLEYYCTDDPKAAGNQFFGLLS